MKSNYTFFKKIHGFTLLEILVVLGIITILIASAAPIYRTFVEKTQFSEVISAALPLQTAVELAVAVNGITSLSELDGGKHNIPANLAEHNNYYVSSTEVTDGTITIHNANMSQDASYTIVALSITNQQIVWSTQEHDKGSCYQLNWC